MYKVLVIGCGNIGAQYDINNNEVQTHVKAWYLNKTTSVSIFDVNKELESKIAQKYNCNIVSDISISTLANFDIVSICSPTNTHFNLLCDAITAKVKTIICEKPISNEAKEMNTLKEMYSRSHSKIIVNYIRRFQPEYKNIKSLINSDFKSDNLTNISIRYQRGFINNCSHALDLIEFLTNKAIELEQIKINNLVFDHFNNDPTLSLMAVWDTTNVSILGLSNVDFSHFEIDMYYNNYKILIKNAGNIIEVYKSEKATEILLPLALKKNLSKNDCIKNYMIPVTDYAIAITKNKNLQDNFLGSIRLNTKMLNYKNN